MGKDKFTASDSNMKNDVERASASNTEEDKASASDIDEDTNNGTGMMFSPDWSHTWEHLKGFKEQASNTEEDGAGECCIYMVPNSLRDRKPEAFSPQLISIGSFHHGQERLEESMNMKFSYQGEFLKRNDMEEKRFIDFLRRIQKEEVSIQLCYSETIRLCFSKSCLCFAKTEHFVTMIVLDAVFIIEFLKHSYDDDFPQTLDTRMISCIGEDLMLLENQLPFFIIDSIYNEFYHPRQDEPNITFLDLATRHFGKFPFAQGPESTPPTDVRHFTDLLMKLMLNGALKRENHYKPIKLKYSAVTLRKGGVKFQVTEDKCLFNVHFENGVLKIPLLEVDDSFERLIRNVMAWEQRYKPGEAYISNYFKFMDHLIDRAEDVALLAEEGIIKNWLGDDAAVSKLMNNLSQCSEKTSYYSDICQTLNDYYENPWNRRRATLKLVYFSNLWRGTGTLAAAFLLILTLIQTITSLKSSF
ncbi:UPF0481 protein At3g47200-like [Populus alba]|uniref:UPF0481 protein At3g47200-like n=1 Tax=Populus alba TaxID=43335 RepID=UPI00158CC7C9|nr:UPF0481 protein At3g47200-like [Populus alba]